MSLVVFLLLTLMGAVFAAQNWIIGGPYGRLTWPRNISVAMTQWWCWAALAPAIIAVSVRYPLQRRNNRRRIVGYMLMCAIALGLHLAMVTFVERITDRVTPGEILGLTAANLLKKRIGIDLLSFWTLVLLGHVAVYHAWWRQRDQVADDLRRALVDAVPPPLPAEHPQRLAVRVLDRTVLLDAADVIWVEAAGNYAVLHTATERHVSRTTLDELLGTLGYGFVRVNRSALVNLAMVATIADRTPQGDLTLVLQTGPRVKLTRTYRRSVMERLPKPR